MTFLEDVEMTIISQHRQIPPYGMLGGSPGANGAQYIVSPEGKKTPIEGIGAHHMPKGSRVILKTPGGGGFLKERL